MERGQTFAAGARAALVMAHPGHELVIHHWIERTQPLAFILTDGSGGNASNRLAYSRTLLERCGARCGGVFGAASDQDWYRAILAGDAGPFHAAIDAIAAACREQHITHIVCDPVELFNPMHDLANAIAHAVALRLQDRHKPMIVATYPIENTIESDGPHLTLDDAAVASKLAAVAAYTPLAHERPRYEGLIAQRFETVIEDAPPFAWLPRLIEQPYYERFGRRRISENRYNDLITYAAHVRPIAIAALRLKAAA